MWRPSLKASWSVWWRCAAAVVLANAPFWLLGRFVFLQRAPISADLVLAIAVLAVSARAGLAALLLAWAIDLVVGQSLTYHFGTPWDFVLSARYGAAIDWRAIVGAQQLAFALPFVLLFALALIALRFIAAGRASLCVPAVAVAAVLVVADAANGSSVLSRHSSWRLPVNIAGSPTANLIGMQLRGRTLAPLVALPPDATAQGLIDIPTWAAAHPGRGILFVVVESLGAPTDPALRAWLDQQIVGALDPSRYRFATVDLPFRGPTTAGELRALCRLGGSFRSLDAAHGATCLPARLRRLGWQTIGMHGFSRRMFDRETWWPLTGLDEVHFIDSPLLEQGPRCGAAFSGLCDTALIDAGDRALRAGNRFVYLLTLNTHLPLAPAPLSGSLAARCSTNGQDREACQLLAALGEVLRRVAAVARESQVQPLIIIVGDHAPPFNSLSSRRAFRSKEVPTYILQPLQ